MADSQSRYEERRIDTGRITLNVRIGGSGPLMLFFHGITANSAVFGPLMDAFSDRFTTVAVDLRGHGDAPAPLALDDTAVAYLIGVAVARTSGLHYGSVVCPGQQVFGGGVVK